MSAIDLSAKQKLVYGIIQSYPAAANDDNILLEQVWLKEGWNQNRSLYENLCSVSNPETITRRRSELYNLELITYTEKATERREEAFKNEKERAAPKAVSWLNDD